MKRNSITLILLAILLFLGESTLAIVSTHDGAALTGIKETITRRVHKSKLSVQRHAKKVKNWTTKNRNALIAAGLVAVALLGASYGAIPSQSRRKEMHVMKVYQAKAVKLPTKKEDEEVHKSIYRVGLLAYEEGMPGLIKAFRKENYGSFVVMLKAYPHLDEALAELAEVSVDNLRRQFYLK